MNKTLFTICAVSLVAVGFSSWGIATREDPALFNAAEPEAVHAAVAAPKPVVAPAAEIVLPETKITGTRPAAYHAPKKAPCDAHDEGVRDLGPGSTVHTYTFCS